MVSDAFGCGLKGRLRATEPIVLAFGPRETQDAIVLSGRSAPLTTSWPDVPAATKAGSTVREQLDYVVWIAEAMEPIGFHPPPELEAWRRRVQTAYSALIDSFTPGHGDPLPPDVPPSVRPGQWPDVPAHSVPGMTVRHQLTVIRTIAGNSRINGTFPRQPGDVSTWSARVQAAFDALDHGPVMPMPPTHRTTPPPAPVKKPSKRRPTGASAGKKHGGTKKPAKAASSKKKPSRRSG